MPSAESDRLANIATPAPFAPPNARELRAQSVKRLQIGLFGLAMMLLLVALANIIMERARMADSATDANAATRAGSTAGSATDPLADLGVIPSPTPEPLRKRNAAH